MKGLLCGILEDKMIGNCSNNGISSKVDCVVVVKVDGELVDGIFEPDDRKPAVEIRKRIVGRNREHYYAVPIEDEEKNIGMAGPMMGGSFIDVSDSRFSFKYPVPLHDRWETWEMYERLSY